MVRSLRCASTVVSKVRLSALGDKVRWPEVRRTMWIMVVGDEMDRKSVLDGVFHILPLEVELKKAVK